MNRRFRFHLAKGRFVRGVFAGIFGLCCLIGVRTVADVDETVVYPAPDGERLSSDYKVWANGKPVDVYIARVNDPPIQDRDYGGDYSFASFDFSGAVTVRVKSLGQRSLDRLVVRPLSKKIAPKRVGASTLEFVVKRPCQLSVEPDGKKRPVLIFANPLEAQRPDPKDPNVKYFGPGTHQPKDGKIELRDNQTLYLAGGAVVQAGVVVRGKNISIRGRGILDGTPWEWRKGPTGHLVNIDKCEDLKIEGIIVRGSPGWTIVPRNSARVTISNVKICNGRVMNDDGVNPCNSQDVRITDCFIRSDDDCVALKGLNFQAGNSNVERITVENCVLWCDRARIFLLGHESRAEYMRRVALRELDIIHFTMTPFLFEPGEDMRLEDISVENVRINGEGQRELIRLRPVVNQYMRKKTPGHIRNVRFENVTLTGGEGGYRVQLLGADAGHGVRDVTFKNVSILNRDLSPDSPRVKIGEHVQGVRFEND